MEPSKKPSCHVHQKSHASHFCLRHERNLCFQCVRANTHCDADCPIIDVALNADALKLKEETKAKLRDNEQLIEKQGALRDQLVQEARDYCDTLTRRIKDSTDKMIETFQDDFNAQLKNVKDENMTLQTVQDTINSQFESLVSTYNEGSSDLPEQIRTAIKEQKDTLTQLEIYTDLTIPTWRFKKNDQYNSATNRNIGDFYSEQAYEVLDASENKSGEEKRTASNEDRHAVTSDEAETSAVKGHKSGASRLPPTPPPRDALRAGSDGHVSGQTENSQKGEASKSNTKKKTKDAPDTKGSAAIPSAKRLIAPLPNSSFEVKDHADKKGPCSYDTIRIFSDKRLLVIDSAHGKVLILHYDGSVEASAKSEGTVHVAVMDDDRFAILSKKGSSIQCFKHESANINQVEKIQLEKNQTRVIGFEYDSPSQTFAVISPESATLHSTKGNTTVKVVIVGNQGQKKPDPVDVTKLKGTFIFPERWVILLHKENKTLKCFSGEGSGDTSAELLWKKRITDSESLIGVNACGGQIFVLLTSCVILFSGKGDPIQRYGGKTNSFLALCVDPNYKVLVLTTTSKDKEASRKVYTVGQ